MGLGFQVVAASIFPLKVYTKINNNFRYKIVSFKYQIIAFDLFEVQHTQLKELIPGARFSKVPKLFWRILGDIILLGSSKRRRLEERNFAVILIYSLYNIRKYQPNRISGSEFYEWLFGPEKFSGL